MLLVSNCTLLPVRVSWEHNEKIIPWKVWNIRIDEWLLTPADEDTECALTNRNRDVNWLGRSSRANTETNRARFYSKCFLQTQGKDFTFRVWRETDQHRRTSSCAALFNWKWIHSGALRCWTKGLAHPHSSRFLCSPCHTSCLTTQSAAACQPTIGCTSILSPSSPLSVNCSSRDALAFFSALSCFSLPGLALHRGGGNVSLVQLTIKKTSVPHTGCWSYLKLNKQTELTQKPMCSRNLLTPHVHMYKLKEPFHHCRYRNWYRHTLKTYFLNRLLYLTVAEKREARVKLRVLNRFRHCWCSNAWNELLMPAPPWHAFPAQLYIMLFVFWLYHEQFRIQLHAAGWEKCVPASVPYTREHRRSRSC